MGSVASAGKSEGAVSTGSGEGVASAGSGEGWVRIMKIEIT